MSRQESKEEEEDWKEKEEGSCCMELRRCILDTRLRYACVKRDLVKR
jgi:hypothetical protein